MFAADQLTLAREVLDVCRQRGLRLGLAESCTGGLLGGCITAIAGSSDVFDRGYVVYQNGAKADMLGVPRDLLDREGAVNEPVARAMAEGVLAHAPVDVSAAITGVSGPGGGSRTKPVGTVFIAAALKDGLVLCVRHHFEGDRDRVRLQSVSAALTLLRAILTPVVAT
jgi:nicotinamide-nucleotide amidase